MTDPGERPLETGWLTDTPPGDNLIRAFTLNQAAVNELVATAGGGRVERQDGVALADAASPVPYYNQALLLRPLTGRDDPLLGTIEAFFAGSAHTRTILSPWPTPDLGGAGWSLAGHPAFVARPAGATDHQVPDAVAVELAADAGQLAVAERVAIEGYPIDEAVGAPAGTVLPPALLGTDLHVRVGLLEGTPVAAGLSHVGHGLVNLCLGATLPAARRRGVWESLVWARLGDAPELPGVAYTSDYSRPGFERMGFLVVTRFTLWVAGS